MTADTLTPSPSPTPLNDFGERGAGSRLWPTAIGHEPFDQEPRTKNQEPFCPSTLNSQPSTPPQPDDRPDLVAFGEIKLRSLSGSLKELIDTQHGVPRLAPGNPQSGDQYKRAAELLTANKLAEVGDWPTIPSSLLVSEVREWWGQQRKGGRRGFMTRTTC